MLLLHQPTRVAICGDSAFAHVLAAILGKRAGVEVRMLVERPEDWGHTISVSYPPDIELNGTIDLVSSNASSAVAGADIVFMACPARLRQAMLFEIAPFIEPDAWIGALPGSGGFNWVAERVLRRRQNLFASQRIPFVCRVLEFGRLVEVSGVRPQTFISANPSALVSDISGLIADLLHIRVVPLPNFLSVALTPTNPVMNPSRLYALFSEWNEQAVYSECPEFYADWDDRSTKVFGACDAELQAICRALPMDLAYVKPIVQHYEVARLSDVTEKIRSLKTLHGRLLPLISTQYGFVLDKECECFTEDVPYGLLVIRSIAEVAGVPTPSIDEIIRWTERVTGAEYLVNGYLTGQDTRSLPLARNLGLDSVSDLEPGN